MNVLLVITFLIDFILCIYSLFNYKNSFIIFLAYNFISLQNVSGTINIGGLEVALSTLMESWYILLYFLIGKRRYNNKIDFPYKLPFWILGISWLLSAIFSIAGIGSEFSRYILNINDYLLLAYLIWNVLQDKKDFEHLFKIMTVIIFISCLYGLIEYETHSNIFQATVNSIQDVDSVFSVYNTDANLLSRGYRVNSIFLHPIGAGIIWGLYVIAVLILKLKLNIRKLPLEKLSYLTAILSTICIFLTKMRSPLIFLFIGIFAAVDLKKVKTYKVLATILLICLIIYGFLGSKMQVFNSLFNSNISSEVGGSSMEQRSMQFRSAWLLIEQSPLLGLGNKFYFVSINSMYATLTNNLLGMESIWMSNLVTYGLIGIFADIIWFYYMLIYLPYKYKQGTIFWINLAYVVTASVTSTPGFYVYLLYVLDFYLINFKFAEKMKYNT